MGSEMCIRDRLETESEAKSGMVTEAEPKVEAVITEAESKAESVVTEVESKVESETESGAEK